MNSTKSNFIFKKAINVVTRAKNGLSHSSPTLPQKQNQTPHAQCLLKTCSGIGKGYKVRKAKRYERKVSNCEQDRILLSRNFLILDHKFSAPRINKLRKSTEIHRAPLTGMFLFPPSTGKLKATIE